MKAFIGLPAIPILLGLFAGPSAAHGESQVAHCIDDFRARVGTSPAFRVECSAAADCEFEPSPPMNASAMAVIDAAVTTLTECWRQSGLTAVESIDAPAAMKLVIRRFRSLEDKATAVCTLAELKPFGAETLTASFRAACRLP